MGKGSRGDGKYKNLRQEREMRMIELSKKIIDLIEQARQNSYRTVNLNMTLANYIIGQLIVEEIQDGAKRAAYGKSLLKQVSEDLSEQYGKGYSVQNLERIRNFYSIYSKSSSELRNSPIFQKSSKSLRILNADNSQIRFLPISWSHYLFLMRIEDELERQFYEIEAFTNQWTLKELERQFNTGLFERLTLSKDQASIMELARSGQIVTSSQDLFKEPLILEFLGLEEKSSYSESDLETAIINQIEKFMLELGKGFFFGGRQVRFTFDEDHFFVDLVLYNRFLKCFVLIDLKIGKLKHQDLGQMQMYVNYYDRFVKTDDENRTIGIIICKDKNDAVVEITLPDANTQLYASKYQTFLPSKESLKQLIESSNDQ